MAAQGDFVISQQPQASERPPSTANKNAQYNGEEIIFEGICDMENVKRVVGCLYCDRVLLIGFLGTLCCPLLVFSYLLFCHGPIGCICAHRVANSWKLLLTHSRIYYMRKHSFCICRCADIDIYVELADIELVHRTQTIAEPQGCFCKTEVPTTVTVQLKKGRRNDLRLADCATRIGDSAQATASPEETVIQLTFTHCSNAEEFVRAVQQQIDTIQRS